MTALPQPKPAADTVLAKAVLRAADQLGLKQAELAAVLGMHRTAVSRLKTSVSLDPASKQGESIKLTYRVPRRLVNDLSDVFSTMPWVSSDTD